MDFCIVLTTEGTDTAGSAESDKSRAMNFLPLPAGKAAPITALPRICRLISFRSTHMPIGEMFNSAQTCQRRDITKVSGHEEFTDRTTRALREPRRL